MEGQPGSPGCKAIRDVVLVGFSLRSMVMTGVAETRLSASHTSPILRGYPGRMTKQTVKERHPCGRWFVTFSMCALSAFPLAMVI